MLLQVSRCDCSLPVMILQSVPRTNLALPVLRRGCEGGTCQQAWSTHAYRVDTAHCEYILQASRQVSTLSLSTNACNKVSLPNGTVRRVYQDGRTVITFPNGDYKRSFPDGEAHPRFVLLLPRHW